MSSARMVPRWADTGRLMIRLSSLRMRKNNNRPNSLLITLVTASGSARPLGEGAGVGRHGKLDAQAVVVADAKKQQPPELAADHAGQGGRPREPHGQCGG